MSSAAVPWTRRLPVDQALALGAGLLRAVAVVAIVRGRAEWSGLPPAIVVHLVAVMPALALTPVMLLRRKGDRLHRGLGMLWVALMAIVAASSFFIRILGHGHLFWIHLISAFTLVQLPRIVIFARRHEVARHEAAVRGMVSGALLIAGVFTFPFGRMLGTWLGL
jgi:uncharacterized membrane protein